jgi:hypothetical protein
MPFKIPERVMLIVKIGESQKEFASRIFFEAAKLAGLPLLQQSFFADYMIASGEHLFVGNDDKLRLKWERDPSPKDKSPLVTDKEWQAKYGKWHTHILGDVNKVELANLQLFYILNGGILGSRVDVSPTEIITLNLNIVYDPTLITSDTPPQTDLEYVKLAMKRQLDYWTKTYSKIGINYKVGYNVGTVNALRQEITSGAMPGMINIFYLNDPNVLSCYSKFNTGSRHIFLSELKGAPLLDRALCHEAGHLFGIVYTTGSEYFDKNIITGTGVNLVADAVINSNLIVLEHTDRKNVNWVNDYRNSPNKIYSTPQLAKLGSDATKRIILRQPTTFDIFRFGARKIATAK